MPLCPTLIVKNTFICAVDTEVPSPLRRRRARTADEARAALPRPFSPSALSGALEAGSTEAEAALWEVRRSAPTLSFSALGCRVVLQALELGSASDVRGLAMRFKGVVPEAARSQHAHRVLLDLIYRLGTADAAFIAEELAGQSRTIARHVHGSAVICRLLEFSGEDTRTTVLLDDLLSDDVATLCCHKFGYHVAMSVVSNCPACQQSKVVQALRGDLQHLARHRFATQVLEASLMHCSAEDRHSLASELMSKAGTVAALACHGFAVHIVRAILQLPGEGDRAKAFLIKTSHRVMKDKYGAQLLRELGLANEAAAAIAAGA